MKLFGTLTSPYTRKARLVLLEKQIPHQFVAEGPNDPGNEIAALNPLGRIPALVLDDETCIFDSVVISEYLDTLNDTPILIPRNDALARMRVRRWEALADGIMDSAVVVRGERVRAPEQQSDAVMELHNDNITRTLAYAAQQLGAQPWCEGGSLSLADLALASALLYLDLRQPERDWRAAHPALAAWFARMEVRSSVRTSMAA